MSVVGHASRSSVRVVIRKESVPSTGETMPRPLSPRAPSSSHAAHSLHEAKRARGRAASRGESLVADECRGPRHRRPPCWCRPVHRTPRRAHQTGPRREAGHARLLTPPRPPRATACRPSKWGLRAARCRGRISHTLGCLSQKAAFVSGRTDPRVPSVRTVAKSPSRGASGSALGQGGGGGRRTGRSGAAQPLTLVPMRAHEWLDACARRLGPV